MIYLTDLIGIPYKENGRTKEEGFDCYGLAIEVYRRMGHKLDDVIYTDHNLQLSDKYKNTLNIKPVDYYAEGVLLELTFFNELHIGVCINEKEFIHTTKNQGVRISEISSYKVKGRFIWA